MVYAILRQVIEKDSMSCSLGISFFLHWQGEPRQPDHRWDTALDGYHQVRWTPLCKQQLPLQRLENGDPGGLTGLAQGCALSLPGPGILHWEIPMHWILICTISWEIMKQAKHKVNLVFFPFSDRNLLSLYKGALLLLSRREGRHAHLYLLYFFFP